MLAPLGKWTQRKSYLGCATLILLESSEVPCWFLWENGQAQGRVSEGREGFFNPVSTASVEVDTCPRAGAFHAF